MLRKDVAPWRRFRGARRGALHKAGLPERDYLIPIIRVPIGPDEPFIDLGIWWAEHWLLEGRSSRRRSWKVNSLEIRVNVNVVGLIFEQKDAKETKYSMLRSFQRHTEGESQQ
jgi:hypothetical protein